MDGTFSVGDRITSLPFIEDKTIGLGAISGAYSEYVKVGYDLVVKLPEGLSNHDGALVEPLAVGLHSVKMAGEIRENQYSSSEQAQLDSPVPYGHVFWRQTCRHQRNGASELAMAETFGFTHFVDPKGDVALNLRVNRFNA